MTARTVHHAGAGELRHVADTGRCYDSDCPDPDHRPGLEAASLQELGQLHAGYERMDGHANWSGTIRSYTNPAEALWHCGHLHGSQRAANLVDVERREP